MSIALLPAVFALEAAMLPAVAITTNQAITISVPTAAVWRALTSDGPIAGSLGLVGLAGLAYPVAGRIVDNGVGSERIGRFSTGSASERITEWVPFESSPSLCLASRPPWKK